MSKSHEGRNKNTPTESGIADRADGRDTADSTSEQQAESRDDATPERIGCAGQTARTSDTDDADADNADGTVLACPDCDSTGIRSMVQNGYGVDADHDHDYRCRHCGATFDEPVERPTKNTPGRSGYLAGRLEDLGPEDVGEPVTDGGYDAQMQLASRLRVIADGLESGHQPDDDVDVDIHDGRATVVASCELEGDR
ncbi:hypothetical protein [Haloarcula pellucida]|nr:hypothetical protein [Halomicroarcula pellucida]MBX0346600.1 hypothetical protein [Halomicroarcula pellucida]